MLLLARGVMISTDSAAQSVYSDKLYIVLGTGAAVMVIFARAGLYRFPLKPARETKIIFVWTAVLDFLAIPVTYVFTQTGSYSVRDSVINAACSVFLVLLGRNFVYICFAHRAWWGCPAVIVGFGRYGRRLARLLFSQPEIGLKPVGILSDRPAARRGFHRARYLGSISTASVLAAASSYKACFLAIMPCLSVGQIDELRGLIGRKTEHLLLMSGNIQFGVKTSEDRDLNEALDLTRSHKRITWWSACVKRVCDVLFILAACPIILPVVGLIALLIRLDSRGGIFYGHCRHGRSGHPITVWKFRTMVAGADKVLDQYLESDQSLRGQWAARRKLDVDPRTTRVGRLLRATSLDELPQLWNVLLGQMSLVGPRPINSDEIRLYGEQYATVSRVPPGITGWWQVHGRSDLSYRDRVRLDKYYACHRSIWLDIHILVRTFFVVLLMRGAR